MPENIDLEKPINEQYPDPDQKSEIPDPVAPAVDLSPAPKGRSWLDILLSPTGPGSVGDYIDAPLNFAKDEGLGQAIRGVTGMLGSLDYAILDVIFGLVRFLKGGAVDGQRKEPVTDPRD